MEKERRKRLMEAGMDIEEALNRCMDDEELLEFSMKAFCMDSSFEKLQQAIVRHDQDAAIRASHNLKGMSGSLALYQLYGLFAKQVEAYRANDWDGGNMMMTEITPLYLKVIEVFGEE